MKTFFLKSLLLFLFAPVLIMAQGGEATDTRKHKIVFQFMDADSISQVRVNGQIGNVRAIWPNAEIEVVCHGGGLDMLMTTKSKVPLLIDQWAAKGITFAACNNTMRQRNVKKEDLLTQVIVVPSAIVELSLKQEDGWSYFKAGSK